MQGLPKKVVCGALVAAVAFSSPVYAKAPPDLAAKEGIKERVERILHPPQEVEQKEKKEIKRAKSPEKAEKTQAEQIQQGKQEFCKRYDFDWQGTPLVKTLYAVAKIADKKIVLNADIQGSVYTSLHQATFDEALDYLAKTFNFNWMVQGDTILVSTSELMLQSQRFSVQHANKEMVKEELKALNIDEKNIYVNPEYNSVSVTGTPYQLAMAQKRILEMDKPVSQCLIVAQLIEISRGKSLDLGMKYALPTYSHSADHSPEANALKGNFINKLTFSSSAQASRSLSKGKVVARPMVMTLNGQEALISMGDKVPVLSSTSTNVSTEVTVEYQDIGSKLKVVPVLNKITGEITLSVDTEISNIAKWITQGNVSAPQISSRKATTSAHLRSGQSLCIGGLMTTSELDNLSGIPGLMNLPILGELFKHHSTTKESSEIFIMITPYIVDGNLDAQAILKK